jgi:protein TonB
MPSQVLIRTVGWIASIGLHGAAFALLVSATQSPRQVPRRVEASFSVVATANAASIFAPELVPNATTSNRPVARSTGRSAQHRPETRQASTPKPADLTGLTLTGDDDATWSSVTGNGQAIVAPIVHTPAATPQPEKPRAAAVAPTRAKIDDRAIVPVKDLAAKPVPPMLDDQLLSNYPSEARRLGIAGRAVVVARIDADGVVRMTRILSESSEGFGSACQKTLLGSRWTEPRDKDGRTVQTQIYYTCDFRVDG